MRTQIEFRVNSRLVAFRGARNEGVGDEGTHYYEFKDGKFVHLKSVTAAYHDPH